MSAAAATTNTTRSNLKRHIAPHQARVRSQKAKDRRNRIALMAAQAMQTVSIGEALKQAERWRSEYNPLRGLTIQRAIGMLEAGDQGRYTELQWTYRQMERANETLIGLIERRLSAIQKLDWNIKIPDKLPREHIALASEQKAALQEVFDGIGNMKKAVEHLAMASFREFAHLEIVLRPGNAGIEVLDPIEQWWWVRDGIYGEWELNEDAVFGAIRGTPVPRERFVIREVPRPINHVGLIHHVRQGLSQKDWDCFIEVYGVPAIFIILPPELGDDQRKEFQEVAEQIVADARGALPGNSQVTTVDNGARGVNPFRDHLEHLDKKLILAGTSGMLTMLTESGSGTLAGGAHQETFDDIAAAEAGEISEVLNTDISDRILKAWFPGQPCLAYFELAANEETDVGDFVQDAATLYTAGWRVRGDQVTEKTGYEVEPVELSMGGGLGGFGGGGSGITPPAPPAPSPSLWQRVRNAVSAPFRKHSAEVTGTGEAGREALIQNALAETLKITPEWLGPIVPEIERLAASDHLSDAQLTELVDAFELRLPELAEQHDPLALAEILEGVMGSAALAGVAEKTEARKTASNRPRRRSAVMRRKKR